MDVGEQVTKSRELQQSKESTSGHVVPVQPKLVPIQLAEKLAVDNLYRYTTSTCTGTTCWKIGSRQLVPVQLQLVPVQLA